MNKVSYQYDAVGNRRSVVSEYQLTAAQAVNRAEHWYTYDKRNRFTLSMGQKVGSNVTSKPGSVEITYDAAGRRVHEIHTQGPVNATTTRRYGYAYDANGYLKQVWLNPSAPTINDGVLLNERTYDEAGRVTLNKDFDQITRAEVRRLKTVFDFNNQVLHTHETVTADTSKNTATKFSFLDNGTLRLNQSTTGATTTLLTYGYKWYDGAAQARITSNQGTLQGASSFKYDLNGRLTQVYDSTTNKQRVLRYETDGEGRIVKRNEFSQEFGDTIITNQTTGEVSGYSAGASADIRTFRYYYDQNGNRIGEVNNVGQPASSRDYVADLAAKKQAAEQTTKADKNKRFVPTLWADFDQSYQPINSDYPGKAANSFAVRTGDTLRSIAQTVLGDSTQWWRIAELNGLIGNEVLTAGMTLLIPNKVTNSSNNAGTFKVYEPGEAIGNTSPNLPDPARKKCNGFVAVLAIVVGAIIFAATSGAASAALGNIFGNAVAGAAASTASQFVNIAGGNQESFSWRQVGVGAIGGGVTGALGNVSGYADFIGSLSTSSTIQAIANAAITSTITQGISSAVGLQAFSWRNVAGAALGAGVGDLAAIGLNVVFSSLDLKLFKASDLSGVDKRPAELSFEKLELGQTVARSLVGLLSGAASSAVVNRGKVDWRGVAASALGGAISSQVIVERSTSRAGQASAPAVGQAVAEDAKQNDKADSRGAVAATGSRSSIVNAPADPSQTASRDDGQSTKPGTEFQPQAGSPDVSANEAIINRRAKSSDKSALSSLIDVLFAGRINYSNPESPYVWRTTAEGEASPIPIAHSTGADGNTTFYYVNGIVETNADRTETRFTEQALRANITLSGDAIAGLKAREAFLGKNSGDVPDELNKIWEFLDERAKIFKPTYLAPASENANLFGLTVGIGVVSLFPGALAASTAIKYGAGWIGAGAAAGFATNVTDQGLKLGFDSLTGNKYFSSEFSGKELAASTVVGMVPGLGIAGTNAIREYGPRLLNFRNYSFGWNVSGTSTLHSNPFPFRFGVADKGSGPVLPGQTGTYGDLKAQRAAFGEIEPLHMDHQPSFAAQVLARENVLGRELNRAELAKLKANTPAVASPREVHYGTSPTYGGRNTSAQIAEDAADLAAAQARDRAAFDYAMRNR